MDFDLVVPFTNLPIGKLRTACPQWRTKRELRPTFIYSGSLEWDAFRGALQRLEANGLVDLRVLDSLLLLIPNEDLLEVPFADWTEDMMASQTSTAFWQLDRDEVLWAPRLPQPREHAPARQDIGGFGWNEDTVKSAH